MRKWGLVLISSVLLVFAAIATPNVSAGDPALPGFTVVPLPVSDNVVVRVYFKDLDQARKIAASFEPMESNYERGYLVLIVSRDDLKRLNDSGLRTEIDAALTAKANQAVPDAAGPIDIIAAIPGFSCYRTVEETYATAQSIALNYPNLATWTDVGNSWEKTQGVGGYDMMILKLTNSAITGTKPKIFITAAIHAREYTTAELMTRFAEQLVANYGVDPDTTWVLDHHELHFMLQTNPDGRKKAETGILWRKNTNQAYCGATSNNRGADLNRNFNFNWGCCGGSSSSQCSETYRGASAGSEPEVQSVRNYMNSIFPDQRGPNPGDAAPANAPNLYLDIHSSGQLLLWPWGYTSSVAPNGVAMQTLGRKFAFFNLHTPEQSTGLYVTDGTTIDYAYGQLGVAAFTFELGTQFFETCSYFTNTLLPRNLPALMYAVKVPRTPYQTAAGPDALSVAVSAGATSPGVPPGTAVNLTASVNDTRYNNTNGTEPTQAVNAAEYYVDTPQWSGGTPIAMSASDGNFNSTVENVTASVNTSGLSNGRHIIFVRGRDASGNWGAFSAVWLYINNGPTPTPTNTPTPTPTPTNTPTPGGGPVVLFSDTFETNLGWTVNPNGTDTATLGQWERGDPEQTTSSGTKQLGTTVSGVNDLVTGRLAGSSAGAFDLDGGLTSIQSPPISLTGGSSYSLSFSYYMAHLNNSSSADFLRVRIVGSTTVTVFEELNAANDDDAVWASTSVSLNAFAGQTVRILIEATDASTASLVEAAIDNVTVTRQ